MWKVFVGLCFLIVAVFQTALFILLKVREYRLKQKYPKGPLPAERIRAPKGGCGVHGCAKKEAHSHVDAFARKVREK